MNPGMFLVILRNTRHKLEEMIEENYQLRPVVTVFACAFGGICVTAMPLNFVPPIYPWPIIIISLIGMITGAVIGFRVGRRQARMLKKLGRELDHHLAKEALDLHQLIRRPRQATSVIRRALADIWRELGSEGEAVGRMYYDPADHAAQPPPPGQHQDPDQT